MACPLDLYSLQCISATPTPPTSDSQLPGLLLVNPTWNQSRPAFAFSVLSLLLFPSLAPPRASCVSCPLTVNGYCTFLSKSVSSLTLSRRPTFPSGCQKQMNVFVCAHARARERACTGQRTTLGGIPQNTIFYVCVCVFVHRYKHT